MNYTDVLTGRIVQRVLEAKKEMSSKVSVVHGVDNSHNINILTNNLSKFFPGSTITLKKLKYGYELRIEVD